MPPWNMSSLESKHLKRMPQHVCGEKGPGTGIEERPETRSNLSWEEKQTGKTERRFSLPRVQDTGVIGTSSRRMIRPV